VRRAWYEPLDKPDELRTDQESQESGEALNTVPDPSPTPAESFVVQRTLEEITSMASPQVARAILMSYVADQTIADTALQLHMCRTTLLRQVDRFGMAYRALDLAA
jgi:DNA-directed RNA polymerase specialized sigma24 family protein